MVNDLAQKVINKKPYLATKIVTYADDGMMYYTDEPLQSSKGYKMKENIDRIKLPCYCTFEWRGKRRLGQIHNVDYRHIQKYFYYKLFEIDKQTHRYIGSAIGMSSILKNLIEEYKINIGKVKLTYYETI